MNAAPGPDDRLRDERMGPDRGLLSGTRVSRHSRDRFGTLRRFGVSHALADEVPRLHVALAFDYDRAVRLADELVADELVGVAGEVGDVGLVLTALRRGHPDSSEPDLVRWTCREFKGDRWPFESC